MAENVDKTLDVEETEDEAPRPPRLTPQSTTLEGWDKKVKEAMLKAVGAADKEGSDDEK